MTIYSDYKTIPGVVATGDLSSYQYYVVCAGSTAGTVKVATTAASDPILGILQNDPQDGEAALVAYSGICKGIAGGGVTYGGKLTCNSTGMLVDTTTDNDEAVGVSLATDNASGDLVPVILSLFTV